MERVGLIGLGLLGSALADRLLQAGHTVLGFDVSPERREALAAAGGVATESVAAMAAQCNVIVLSLPDSRVVAEVIESIAPSLHAGQRIVDTSTGEPLETAAMADKLAKRGVDFLDATILGSSVQVRDGQAIVMVGGSDAAFVAARELLSLFGCKLFHVGVAGSGTRMKLVVNLVLGLNRAVLAEGLTLASALELDLPSVLAVLKAGAAYSAVMDTKGDKMLARDFTPQARLSQHLKDVRLMLAAAARTDRTLPLSETHRQLLERAEAAGFGDADNSAVLQAYG